MLSNFLGYVYENNYVYLPKIIHLKKKKENMVLVKNNISKEHDRWLQIKDDFSFLLSVIVNEEEFSQSTTLYSNVKAYPWHIDTKYYTTDVHICALEDKTCNSEEFTSSIEAVILQFDSNQNNGLDVVTSWFPFIEKVNPEVRILVCDRCLENPSSGTSKLAAQEWCIARGFELVELNAELDEEWEDEQDFIETTGVARIIQALHAHMWPNLSLKDESNPAPPGLQSLLVNGSNGAPAPEIPTNGQINDLADNIHNFNFGEDDDIGYDILNESQDEGSLNDDYFELFQNLAAMKERVVNMPSEERKACAERVVRAFWTAMGGDSAELSDLEENGNDSD